MLRALSTLAVVFALATPRIGRAQKNTDPGARPHKGLLLQAGIGLSYSRRDQDWGLSLPSLTIGTYARRNVIVGAHFSGATHLPGVIGQHPYAFMMGFYGPVVEYWWDDRVYLGIACGLYYYTQRNNFAQGAWVDTISGLGIALKGAMTAYGWDGGRVNVFAEVLPAFFRNAVQVSTVVGVEWQMP